MSTALIVHPQHTFASRIWRRLMSRAYFGPGRLVDTPMVIYLPASTEA